jgi:hypothetical protein
MKQLFDFPVGIDLLNDRFWRKAVRSCSGRVGEGGDHL